ASMDRTIKLWDVAAEPNPLVRVDAKFMAFAPDGRKLASSSGKEVKLWDTATWRLTAAFRSDTAEATSMSYSSDAKTLALGSKDETAKLWDVAAGKERFVLKGHTGQVWAVALSPNGNLLATGSEDKTIRLWDVTTGQEMAKLEGHGAPVRGVAFSP